MTALTTAEKALLRADGHKVSLYLSILAPDSILVARLNNSSISRGDRSIAYDGGTGTAGEYGRITAGQPLWVGSSAGAKDKGIIRVKSITGDETSGTITVAENAVDMADNDFLTIKEDYPLFPKFPRIATDGTFYVDYSIEYTDENELPPPVAIAGPHRAGFLASGTVRFYLDATESYVIASGATLSSYAWACTGGSIDDAAASQTFIDFVAAGTYWLKLTVTDDNSKSHSTYRAIFVHSATVGDADYPHSDFELATFNGSWGRGGWNVNLTARDVATTTDLPDNTLIVIWQDAIYGSTNQDIGGWVLNDADARNVLFAGYVRGDTVTRNWATGQVAFQAATINGQMINTPMFAISLDYDSTPNRWYQYANLNVPRALHHYWHYHSTLFEITDVILPVAVTSKIKYLRDLIMGNLFTVAKNFAYHAGIDASVCSSKQGRLHVEQDVNMINTAARAAVTTKSDITESDRRGDPDITIVRQHEKRSSAALVSGFAYDGATDSPLISIAPGIVPEDQGSGRLTRGRQVLASQTDCNERCGRVLAIANNEYPEIRIPYKGHYAGALDMVPQEWWTLTLAAGDTERGISFTDKKLAPRQVSIRYDAKNGTIYPDVVFETEAQGPDGITSSYPTSAPTTNPEPPTPPTPPEPPAPGTPTGLGTVYVFNDTHVGRTVNFDADGGASWVNATGALAGKTILDAILDPWDPANKAFVLTTDGVYRTTNLGISPTWSLVLTPARTPVSSGKLRGSINEEGFICLVYWATSSNTGVHTYHTHNGGDSWTAELHVIQGVFLGSKFDGAFDIVPHLVGGAIWMYALVKPTNAGGAQLRVSHDGGHTWANAGAAKGALCGYAWPTYNYCQCPYQGNEDGLKVYYGFTYPGSGGTGGCPRGKIYFTHDGNATSATIVDSQDTAILPATSRREVGEAHTYDYLRFYYWSSDSDLYLSSNAGNSFSLVNGSCGFAGAISAAGGFPYNDQLFYALAGGIYFSTDGGVTFKDATGDWVSAVGAFGTGRVIVPMWLE